MPNVSELDPYLKADHVKDGDTILFIDGGKIVTKEFNKDGKKETQKMLEMTVQLPSGERKVYAPNKTTRNNLSEAWGVNSDSWASKRAKVLIVNQLVFDKVQKVLVLEPLNDIA